MTIQDWLGANNELGISIWERKYRYNNESFDEWLDRVSGGNSEVKEIIKNKEFLFGGRILANRGLPRDGIKTTYSNCFSGETKIITSKGAERLRDLVGKPIKVLTNHGWSEATVRSFGKQPVKRLTVRLNKFTLSYLVTGDHIWFVCEDDQVREVKTDDLEKGMKLQHGFNVKDDLWEVESVSGVVDTRQVYCAVVPGAQCFTLDCGILTHNCFVVSPPEDNLESIFGCASKLARTYSYGGGCGIDLSKLAPEGAKVRNAAKQSSGAVSFMDLYSMVTGLISQNGKMFALLYSNI